MSRKHEVNEGEGTVEIIGVIVLVGALLVMMIA